MKKSLLIISALCFLASLPANSQTRLLKKIANDVAGDVLGTSGGKATTAQPEPACACTSAELVFDLGSKKLVYSEVGIDVLDNGSILIQDKISGKYYITRDGVSKGPFSEKDPQVTPYINRDSDENNPLIAKYRDYISKTGDKFQIKFNGKIYGPYAEISSFSVTRSKDKFAAVVVENLGLSKERGEMMNKALENAKTDQEKIELAMKFSQEVQQSIMAGGGPDAMTPKVISNIDGVSFNPSTGGTINGSMKYDDILVNKFNTVTDLKENTIIAMNPEHSMMTDIFVNTGNTKYAAYNYGTITFSDGTTMSELFNPYLVKTGGNVNLAYMYYSPAKNSIMQCKIVF